MQPILIYSEQSGPRLLYVLNWIFNEQLGVNYRLINNEQDRNGDAITISYGGNVGATLNIPSAGLLWGAGISEQNVNIGTWNDLPAFFSVPGRDDSLPFDIFSAIFFLLSRYEEYYPYTPDKHGRYPATESILYKKSWLRRPLIDEWLLRFRQLLQTHAGLSINAPGFSFIPTYDIDIAWSYLHKGFARNAGGFLKDLLSGSIQAASERVKVLRSLAPDPFDSYAFISTLHNGIAPQPTFFILAALKNTAFDKNILPGDPAMQQLVGQLAGFGNIGMHPSYYTGDDPATWQAEKNILEKISDQKITRLRQHYIKMKLPDTYHALLANSISDDHSMGYGTHLGFRAGTGRSFNWYDIERECEQALAIHPFCFMDSAAHYEERLDADNAFAVLNEMKRKLQETGSVLTTVFHNFSLGTDKEWNGWGELYKHFVQNVAR